MKNNNNSFKSIIAAISGNFIEWYDFALYLFLAPVLAKQFFEGNETLALLGTLTIHAVSFFFRPLGAMIFGHIGDVYGRAIALRISLSGLAALSIVMALLPNYDTLGILATVLLCLCRIGQGICLGGEFAGSMVYLAESVPLQRRSFFTSLSNNASNVGILVASASAMLLSSYTDPIFFSSYGYRILFFMGGIIGVLGFAFRSDLKETTPFLKLAAPKRKPLISVIKNHNSCRRLLLMLNISALGSYALIGYMSTFLNQSIAINMPQALRYETFFIACTLLLVPLFAYYTDRLSSQRMFKNACLMYIALSVPCYYLFYTYNHPLFLLPLIVAYSMEQSSAPALMVDFFPTEIRYTGISITYNTCMAFIGGLSPLVCQLLLNVWQWDYGIGYLLVVGAIVAMSVVNKKMKTHAEDIRMSGESAS